jgi:hypothetical protein
MEGFDMSGIAAAIAGSAVIGGIGSVIAGGEAASATRDAANTAAQTNRDALAQQLKLAGPYTEQGQSGIQSYNALTTGSPQQIQATLQNTPGYQATYGEGIEAAQRAAAASGLNLSGNQLAGVESFGAQLGDATYQEAINNALTQEQIGQAAAAGSAANIGNTASNLSNIAINQGNNIANIDSNQIAGLTRAASGAANQAITYGTLQNLNTTPSVPTYSPASIDPYAPGVTGIGQPVQSGAIST